MTRLVFPNCVLMLVCLLVFDLQGSVQSHLQPPSEPIRTSYFGLHMHYADSKTPWPNVPFGAWRLWDAYVQWPHLEPEKGKWDFKRLDRYIEQAEANRTEILLPLGLTPQWASARPNEKSGYGLGWAAEPVDLNEWRTYVRTVATRYKGRVHQYEIWNEPNLPMFFTGKQETLVTLASEAYRILKQVDPKNVVVSPAATGEDGVAYLDSYLQHGGGKFADVIGFHFYTPTEAPETMLPLISRVRGVMAKNGVAGKALWNTEAGWSILNHQPTPLPYPFKPVLDDAHSAAYVARAFVLAWAGGVTRYYWYAWDDEVMGLLEPDHRTAKASSIAFREVTAWLTDETMQSCTAADGLWTCALTDARGRRSWIVWNSAGETTFALPRDWRVGQARELSGTVRKISSANVTVGPSPLLLQTGNR